MKKILIVLTIVISCLGISNVKASELFLTDTSEEKFIYYKEKLGSDNFNNIVNDLLNEYKKSYMIDYPYYIISPDFHSYKNSDNEDVIYLDIVLSYYNVKPTMQWSSSSAGLVGVTSVYTVLPYNNNTINRRYYIYDQDGDYSYDINTYEDFYTPHLSSLVSTGNGQSGFAAHYEYNSYLYYISNFDLYLNALNDKKGTISSGAYIWDYDTFYIPKLSNNNYSVVSFLTNSYVFEPYYLYDADVDIEVPGTITEINLNDYSYVILTLKNYEQDPFSTSIEVKGQFCSTPVYSLGTESSEETFGTNVKNVCTPYYDTYTPYVINYYSDYLDNFAFLYVKAYDTTKENYIKVDNRIFDISYITEENKDKPLVNYQGNSIPTIPYDDLPSTATQNTQTGYVPDYGNSFSFTDIFKSPLNFLKEVWSTIVTFFSLITSFIALLPPELRGFLFASFTLGIGLGLVKILIGAF